MTLRATANSWKIKPMPSRHRRLLIEGSYATDEMRRIELGYIPAEQQDKWFVYFDEEWLHFHRSWTGTCIFQLHLTAGEACFQADTLVINQDPSEYKMDDDAYNLSLVAYLVDHLLLGRFAQLPFPGKMTEQDQTRHQQHVMGQKRGENGSIPLNLLGPY